MVLQLISSFEKSSYRCITTMQTFGLNVVIFVRFSPEVCIFGLLGGVTIAVYDDCTILDKSVEVHGNADGQCNDSDGQRYGQLDDHED